MFLIICLVIFLGLCTATALIARNRGGGSGERGGVDNHNALQNGSAKIQTRRSQENGHFGSGPSS